MAVVRQGREVVSVLSQAIQQLQVGDSKKSTALLRQLRDDASILSTETQDLLQQLHNVQEYYKDQVEVRRLKFTSFTSDIICFVFSKSS